MASIATPAQVDPRVEQAFKHISAESTIGPNLTPREIMVIVLALAERAGAVVPEDESSENGDEYTEGLWSEADAVLSRVVDHITR